MSAFAGTILIPQLESFEPVTSSVVLPLTSSHQPAHYPSITILLPPSLITSKPTTRWSLVTPDLGEQLAHFKNCIHCVCDLGTLTRRLDMLMDSARLDPEDQIRYYQYMTRRIDSDEIDSYEEYYRTLAHRTDTDTTPPPCLITKPHMYLKPSRQP